MLRLAKILRDDSYLAPPFRQRLRPVKFTTPIQAEARTNRRHDADCRTSRTCDAYASDKIVNNAAQVVATRTLCDQRRPMKQAPALLALDRIEEALARIEAAANTAMTASDLPPTAAPPPQEDADLRHRHENLKASVSRSLAELDELLAGRSDG